MCYVFQTAHRGTVKDEWSGPTIKPGNRYTPEEIFVRIFLAVRGEEPEVGGEVTGPENPRRVKASGSSFWFEILGLA